MRLVRGHRKGRKAQVSPAKHMKEMNMSGSHKGNVPIGTQQAAMKQRRLNYAPDPKMKTNNISWKTPIHNGKF